MKHTDAHKLPISQGHRAGGSAFSARCNRCAGWFDIDSNWVDRYVASRRNYLRNERSKQYYGEAVLGPIEREIKATERKMRKFVAANTDGALGRAADEEAARSDDVSQEIARIFRTFS